MLVRLRSFLRGLLLRNRLEHDLDAEVRFHIECRVRDLVRAGSSRPEAERRARLEFGAVASTKERSRAARGLRWPDELYRNIRYAIRILGKSPAFTASSILTLGLCIGANTAVFSVVDAVLLRPLPYPEPDRLMLVAIRYRSPGGEGIRISQTGNAWEAVRDHADLVDRAVFRTGCQGVNLVAAGEAQYVFQQRVSAGFFRVLGVEPIVGREFDPSEDQPGGPAVVVLSHALAKRLFGDVRSAPGRAILFARRAPRHARRDASGVPKQWASRRLDTAPSIDQR